MAKYIDADKLRLSMADAFCLFDIPFNDLTAKIVFKEIDCAPAVKIVEGKHCGWTVKETCGERK